MISAVKDCIIEMMNEQWGGSFVNIGMLKVFNKKTPDLK